MSPRAAGAPASKGRGTRASTRDRALARAIERWFPAVARDLPWRRTVPSELDQARGARRDPYAALVSEFMLQQTQVARVIERFEAFLERFPDVASLASAHEQDVLALWSGLGYYSRARNLHACAREIVARFDGRVPPDPQELASLPGVGRYTSGAIASMAFGVRTPAADGNVLRVLVRLDARETPEPLPALMKWVWERAGSLATQARDAGVLNEALMELGATVCTPSNPRCKECPIASLCVARADGRQYDLPAPKRKPARTPLSCATLVAQKPRGGQVLLQQRPGKGLWAGLWQAPTIERRGEPYSLAEVRAAFGQCELAGSFTHATSHREVRFDVYRPAALRASRGAQDRNADGAESLAGEWRDRGGLSELPISSAHRRALEMVLGPLDVRSGG